MLETLPWWMYFVVLGILVSGYMTLYWNRKEHILEQVEIEEQGKVYMERIHNAREKQ
ncbi:MAG: sporulation YhaL family protein [Bacilli bacterium]